MTLYLIDEPLADIALSYAAEDKDARIVLLQDGVYLAQKGEVRGEAYVVKDDVSRRGLGTHTFPPNVHAVGYDELVQMMENDRVVCFL